ncbi:DUF6541 family protein [Collinsella intestinalis]|uniref:DUF6541 family protein n=1 Tax=Collinsella intestinalis TaxID=147207 RepID=UPI001957B6F2|nr:DUF6541 family protein [Collinsella intestinalis]MBM6908793.1 hypothetical protein [Collinsella intestinalis]
MQWTDFLNASIITFCILYLPGFILLKSLKATIIQSITCSPLLSVAVYNVLAIVYSGTGIKCSFATLFMPFFVVCTVLLLLSMTRAKILLSQNGAHGYLYTRPVENRRAKYELIALTLFWFIALILSVRYFIIPLDGASSFVQDSDNSFHLALIRSFLESGNYSSLATSLYPDAAENITSLVDPSSSFYPSAWHCICALVVDSSHASITVSVNAVNFILLAIVFPASVYSLLLSVYRNDLRVVIIGAFFTLAFQAFPWGALYPSSGPLYPNFIGFCLMPLLCSAVINLINNQDDIDISLSTLLILTGIISCTLSHPNVLFSAAVILFPFCISRLYRLMSASRSKRQAIVICILTCIFSCLAWLVVYSLPFMKSIVSFEWAPITSIFGALEGVVSLSLRMIGIPQWILGGVVVIGLISIASQPKLRWLCFSWAIVATMYVVCAGTDGILENILTGFWYTDPYRVAFLVAIVGIIAAPSGVQCVARKMLLLINNVAKTTPLIGKKPAALKMAPLLATGFIVVLVSAGIYKSNNVAWGDANTTAFGNLDYCLTVANDSQRPNTFSPEEQQFVNRVSLVVDPSYKIYNCADDGSPFAYAIDGLNLCYRRSAAELIGNESPESYALRVGINELSSNTIVQNIIEEADIKYILVLDYGGEAQAERCYYGYYTWDKWIGINSITDNTPGLKLLLKDGDMRLYEIE